MDHPTILPRRRLWLSATFAGTLIATSSFAYAQPYVPTEGNWEVQPHLHPVDAGGGKQINLWHVQGRVYMVTGAGPNIIVQLGEEATLVVNAGARDMSAAVVSAINELSNRPIEFVIDTDADMEDVSGSAEIAKSGFENTGAFGGEPKGAGIIGQQGVLDDMVATKAPSELWPTDAFDDDWQLYNDEAVLLYHAPAAHTSGDSYVYFRGSDVICTGNLFDPLSYPTIEEDKGGTLSGLVDALNSIIDMMVPRQNEEGGTFAVPDHGRMTDRSDVVSYRDALTVIRARVAYDVGKGMTLDQVQKARPTFDYDGLYGSDTGHWTTQMFVAAVYDDVIGSTTRHPRRAHVASAERGSYK
jgi:glyoxylase-like metal-dependent hydrolase (beta-lactamase superfamily II)